MSANSFTDQSDNQGLFFDHLVRQQFTWFGGQQQALTTSAIATRLAEHLETAMGQTFENPKRLLFVRLTLGEQLPAMLDLVLDQTDTDDPMRRTINSESWVAKELLQWVNAPRFRQITATSHDFVGSLDQALSHFGGKILAFQLVEFAMIQAAGRKVPFCQLMNRRILEWSQEMAQCARLLAERRGLCPALSSLAALTQGLAPLAISQAFVDLFDNQIKQALEKSRQSAQKQVYDQIKDIRPPVGILASHLARSSALQHSLLNELGATGQIIASLTREADADLPVGQLSEMAQVLRQARGYCQYRWLNDACALTPHQSHSLLADLALSEDEMADLSRLRRR
ncbi:hypothetical protein K0504_03030 [Neiella marina]|uniref:HDOD domain-containing protein n=1 Tax=Neiella holothuriorum TaxID=2870530 RepID=A0ABS7ECD4_9GAMM|nr:hypothetical protein [Neiella holothuriorum]MBW8189996.1 hypothetical protein [Neiella holothuriorum]